MPQLSVTRIVFCLTPLAIALAFAMDIYIPAVPTLTRSFHVSIAQMQLTLNLFMLVSGFSQLFFGPLTDRFGRRRITFLTICIFTIASMICSQADTLSALILGRTLQAIGSCGMLVLSFAIARDLCNDQKLAKVYSYLNGAIAISPMFGPFIGSYLDVHFGWPATFESLLVISILAGSLYFMFIPESWPQSRRQPITSKLLSSYLIIFSHRTFFIYTLTSAFGLSYLFIFCAISPILIITLLHVPELHYGYYFCFMGISLFLGSLISGMIVEKIGIFNTVLYGLLITFLGAIFMLAINQFYGLTLYGFVLPMVIIGIGGTFCLGAGSGGSMIPFSHQSGMAAALGGACRFLYAGFIGLIIAKHIHSTLPLAIPACIQSLAGICLLYYYRHQLRLIEQIIRN
ncbi:MAG: Bcr/CflA family drug resistance efflux transporter [Coxiellaceae bacterium]|nr:Bcr/CflA family drug resistance efflux transporter [Coxiellaceae bacterium]